jgi:hypothetical protein
MSTVKIQSGKSLKTFLSTVIDESIKSTLQQRALQEKQKQKQFAMRNEAAESEEPDTSKTGDDDKEALEKGDVTTEDVVEKLNSIRSGKSFKDENVKTNMEQYIESLSEAERTALFAFLKGISQIVTGEVSAKQAADPADKPADIEMKKGGSVQKKSIKPNVIRTQMPKKDKKSSPEDTSGPVPITPKKK